MTFWGCYNFIRPIGLFSPVGYSRPLPPPMPMATPHFNAMMLNSAFMSPVSTFSSMNSFWISQRPAMPMSFGMPFVPMSFGMPLMPSFNYPNFATDLSIFSSVNDYIINGPSTSTLSYTLPKVETLCPCAFDYSKTAKSNSKKSHNFLGLTGSSRTSSRSNRYHVSTNTSLQSVLDVDYNPKKGERLAEEALKYAESGSTGWCAKYVKEALQRANLYNGESGHAYSYIEQLRYNPNFKEVSMSGMDLNSLPAGCIIVYDRDTAHYSKEYGHIEITTGEGCAVSDFVNCNIRSANSGVHVFVPV